ncbi:MAG TPA: hypothetical protein VFU47_07260 [Armatimonadota bacterium]|nr:hypothetical protein [Armatimonadota bacterium]
MLRRAVRGKGRSRLLRCSQSTTGARESASITETSTTTMMSRTRYST